MMLCHLYFEMKILLLFWSFFIYLTVMWNLEKSFSIFILLIHTRKKWKIFIFKANLKCWAWEIWLDSKKNISKTSFYASRSWATSRLSEINFSSTRKMLFSCCVEGKGKKILHSSHLTTFFTLFITANKTKKLTPR